MTSRSLTVRRATTDDSASIAGLINAAFAGYRPWLVPPSGALEETIATIAAQLAGVCGAAIAERDGEPCARVLFRPEGADLYFGRLSVLPAHRGSGVADAMVAFVEDEARVRGCPGVVLEVRIALPANQRLFARLGYVEIARHAHTGFADPTWIEMRKTL